jgi:hypothetical protein
VVSQKRAHHLTDEVQKQQHRAGRYTGGLQTHPIVGGCETYLLKPLPAGADFLNAGEAP